MRLVYLEPGTRHVLAYCSGCSPWRRLAGDRAAALLAAADHLELVHDQGAAASQLRRQAAAIATRHAQLTRMPGESAQPG